MMTEDEAKTKWCPQTRHASAPSPTDQNWETNRLPGTGFDAYCIGSACMMWRAEVKPYTRPGGDPLAHDHWKPKKPTGRGYCGLAGKPE